MTPHFPRLFQPLSLGSRQSRNRIMRLATSTNTGENTLATQRMVDHYRRLARGGTGVIVSEAMRVHSSNTGSASTIQLYREQSVAGVEQVARAVHAEGALFIAQLNHGGRQHHSHAIPTLWAPSAIACPQSGGVPHQMSKPEIAELVAGFAIAAFHARQAGCDGVEIHGAQGHLVQQFVSAFSNRREDEYGGSLDNRLRLPREIISAVREKAGPGFIIGYRMGIDEFTSGGITVEESKLACVRLAKLGAIDYLSLTQGNFNTIDTHCPDSHYPPLTYVDIQAQIKAAVGTLPVVASGRIQTPEQAEAIIGQGKADLVGMCRTLTADPRWPEKARQGRSADIRRCICCNHCWGGIVAGKRLACTMNSTIGFESDLQPLTRSDILKHVVVIGGGPAGLEAARVAAKRGHRVMLYEENAMLGGRLAAAADHAAYHEARYAVDFLARQVTELGVLVRTATVATCATVLAQRPDAVIVATGARPYAPVVSGDGSVQVVTSSQASEGSTVVLMDEDGYYWASCVTEQIARRGCKVIYVTRFHEPLRELPQISNISTQRSLDKLGVVLRPAMFVDRIEHGAVVLRHYYNSQREERYQNVAEVVWIGPQRANDGVAEELRAAGFAQVRVVGDAYAPRRLANAIAEGNRAAREV